MAEYIAYNYGKMNQSFMVKDSENKAVYEANQIKFKLFSACDFEFVNRIDLVSKKIHKVGKTMTKEQGVGGVSFATASYFKFDGENVFNILESKGYSFKLTKVDLIHPVFSLVDNNGKTTANYRMNVKGPRQEGVMAIGNYQTNTVIETESEDLEIVFFAAFILNRVDFSAYLV